MTDISMNKKMYHINVSTHYLLNNFYLVLLHSMGMPRIGHANRWLQALAGVHPGAVYTAER